MVENKVQDNSSGLGGTQANLTDQPIPNPQVSAQVSPVPSLNVSPRPPSPKRSKIAVILTIILLLLLVLGTSWFIYDSLSDKDVVTPPDPVVLPLDDFLTTSGSTLVATRNLTVNGQLQANDAFIISPSAQPSNATAGQIYYDQTSNKLMYYNGSKFIELSGDVPASTGTGTNDRIVNTGVLSLQGQTGNINLTSGGGIAIDGTTLTNTGVLSLAGATGNITLGSGLALAGNELRSTGVNSLTAGTANLVITNDGAGNITISDIGGGSGTVISPGGTPGRLAKFTGVQTIEDSLISESGAVVTVNGDLAVAGTTTLANPLTVGNGGTGATSLANNGVVIGQGSGALTAITAGAPGQCLLSTAGAPAFGICPGGGGGGVTSVNGLTGALTIANATGAGTTLTIDDASTTQKGIAQFNPTNFTAASGVINTIQDINTTAAPTFGRLTLSSSQASSPMLLINNTNGAATGNLIDLQLNGASRLALSPAGNMTLLGTLNGQTISSAANFTGTLAVAGNTTLAGDLAVNGGDITSTGALTITPGGTLTAGSTSQTLLLQGNSASSFTATNGANTTSLIFQAPTANVSYRLPTAVAGTYDICTTAGNCSGTGGGVTTPGGTVNTLAKFTGAQTIGDSIITDDGTTVAIAGTLAVNTITPSSALTIGSTGQNLILQGATTSLTSTSGGITNTLTFAPPSGSNKTITVPNASGTLVVSASSPLLIDANGNISCPTCAAAGSGVTSLNGLAGALTIANATGAGSTITINDASTTQKGIAQFNPTNFSGTGTINTIQDIHTAATPTFGTLTLTSSQATSPMLLVNNLNAGATGNLIDLQQNGVSRLSLSPAGNMTLTGTINGQTISSAANFTGTLAVAGNTTLAGDLAVNGGDVTSTGALNITPGGALTVGANNQTLTLQGNGSTSLSATVGANTTTVGFQSPTANVTYNFATAAAGTYDICTTAGNCSGTGGGVTTPGGTTNQLAKFTSAQTIGDSIISDNGSTVTIAGTLAVNTITPTGSMAIGSPAQALTLQGNASTTLAATNGGITNSLVFATPTTSNKTITLPNASGTVAVSASGPILLDANGNISCPTCATSGAGVTSLNSLTGALNIANATGAGSTITIDDATTSSKGIASFNPTNFTVTAGAVNTIQDINTTAAPTFGQLTLTGDLAVNGGDITSTGALTITPGGTLTVGSTSQTLALQGNVNTTLSASNGANATVVSFQPATANVNYRFATAAAGTYDVCTTAGNCTGTAVTLQGAYNNGNTIATTDARDISFTLADTATDSNLAITTASGSTGFVSIARADGAGTADSPQLLLVENQDADRISPIGLKVQSAAGGMTTGVDLSDAEIVNALSLGDNNIVGGLSNIDLTNFDVTGSTGNVTMAGDLAVNGGDITSTGTLNITPGGALVVGATTQTAILQGSVTTLTSSAGNDIILNSGDTIELQDATNVTGALSATGTLTVGTLGVTNTATQVCLNASNQLAGCSASGTGAAFVQGGNSFGTTAVLGTNDANGLNLEVNNVAVATFAANGAVLFKNQADSATAFQVQNATSVNFIGVNTTTSAVTIGNTTGATSVAIQGGTGGISLTTQGTGAIAIGNNAVAQTINIGNSTGTTAVSVLCGTGVCGFGNNATAHSTIVGSTTGASATTIQAGTAGLSLISGANVAIGTSNTTGTLLVLDTKTDSTDPTGVNGGMYYNSASGRFRCYQAGAWSNCFGATAAEYLRAEMRTIQDDPAEVDQDDHIKFANVQASSGSSISLDTSSPYVEGGTGASIGRFTLTAGKTYKLHANINQRVVMGGPGSIITYGWYNVTGSTLMGSSGSILPSDWGGDSREQGAPAEVIFTPSGTTIVEVRLIDLNGGTISSIGFTSAFFGLYPNAFIEVLSDGTQIGQFGGATASAPGTNGFVPGAATGQQGSVLLGDGTWSTGVTFLSGAATFQNASNSTTAFRVLNATGTGSVPQFVIDTTNSRVYIGNPSSDTTGAVLVLDTKSDAGDPTATGNVNGAMYYNGSTNKFRCYENSMWVNCGSGLNDAVTVETLQAGGAAPSNSNGVYAVPPTPVGATFIAPPSGKVMLSWTADMLAIPGSMRLSPEVRTGSVIGSGTIVLSPSDDYCALQSGSASMRGYASKMVTGLTPGSTYNVRILWKTSDATNNYWFSKQVLQTMPVW